MGETCINIYIPLLFVWLLLQSIARDLRGFGAAFYVIQLLLFLCHTQRRGTSHTKSSATVWDRMRQDEDKLFVRLWIQKVWRQAESRTSQSLLQTGKEQAVSWGGGWWWHPVLHPKILSWKLTAIRGFSLSLSLFWTKYVEFRLH